MSEEDLVYYSAFCGPAAVAAALEIPRIEAARMLAAVKIPTNRKTTNVYTIAKVVGFPVDQVRKPREEWLDWRGNGYGKPGLGVRAFCPSLAAWLKDNETEAIIRASTHFLYVYGSEVIESNKYTPRRARVTHAIYLDGMRQ